MAVPLIYNIKSLWLRRSVTAATCCAISLSVAVTLLVLAVYTSIRDIFAHTGQPANVIATRTGSESEYMSMLPRSTLAIVKNMPGIARDRNGEPVLAGETISIVLLPRKDGTGDVNVTVRGIQPASFDLRPDLKLVSGRWFNPGVRELVVSESIQRRFSGTNEGDSIHFGKGDWNVVGVFSETNTAQESELLSSQEMVANALGRPLFSSFLLKVNDPKDKANLVERLRADNRLHLHAVAEADYYRAQRSVGSTVELAAAITAAILALGCYFAILNTMLTTVASRTTDTATLRVLGFSRSDILTAYLTESLAIALVGAVLGVLETTPFWDLTTGTFNGFTFSELVFTLRFSPTVFACGLSLAILLGLCGGLFPAFVASTGDIKVAIRR